MSTRKTRQRAAAKRTPYRLAVKKTSSSSRRRKPSVGITPYPGSESVTTCPGCLLHGNNDEITCPAHQVSVESNNVSTEIPPMTWEALENQLRLDRRVNSAHYGEQAANFGARLLSAGGKIKPIWIVLLSTVLATPVLVGIGLSKSNDDGTSSKITQRYEKFSHDMLQLQKRYVHQSAWLWHGLRITAWQALTEPLYTMPMALLMVIPYGYEHVGHCIATNVVDSFNKVHGQKTTEQMTCSNSSQGLSQNETADYHKQISLTIRAARQAHQSAVLIDKLEKLNNASLPILDKFLDLDANQAENKLLIFTIYVPLAHCNPYFVRMFLVETWISQVFARPTIAKKLVDNALFITPYDASVICK